MLTKTVIVGVLLAISAKLGISSISSSVSLGKQFKTIYGHNCVSSCFKYNNNKFGCWALRRNIRGKITDLLYSCSPEEGKTIKGENCKTKCESYLGYYFCYTGEGKRSWDYCGPVTSKIENNEDWGQVKLPVYSIYGDNCVTPCKKPKGSNHYQCWVKSNVSLKQKERTFSKVECSYKSDMTYKGESCKTPCQAHKKYHFCYTDKNKMNWDYCGPTQP